MACGIRIVFMAGIVLWLYGLPGCSDEQEAPAAKEADPIVREVAACLARDDADGALAVLDRLPGERQDEAGVLHQRGLVALHLAGRGGDGRSARLDEAERHLTDALARSPESSGIRIDLTRPLCETGRFVAAIRILDEGLALDRENALLHFRMAEIYLAADEASGALKAVDTGLALAPERAAGLFLKGRILFSGFGKLEEGLDAMRKALEKNPDLPGGKETVAGLLANLAGLIDRQGQADKALLLAEEALRLHPGSGEALAVRGGLLVRGGKIVAGIDDLRRALELDPGNDEVRGLLAGSLKLVGYGHLRSKERERALDLFREAVELDAPGVDVAFIKRLLEMESSGSVAADAIPSDPRRKARDLFDEGSLLLQEGKTDQAIGIFREALDLMPNNPFIRHQLGLALIVEQRLEEGEKELRKAVQDASEAEVPLPEAYAKLADLALRDGRRKEAREWLDLHDTLYPARAGDPVVSNLRSLLEE